MVRAKILMDVRDLIVSRLASHCNTLTFRCTLHGSLIYIDVIVPIKKHVSSSVAMERFSSTLIGNAHRKVVHQNQGYMVRNMRKY